MTGSGLMDLMEFYPLLKSAWVVLAMALFLAIVAWALAPSRKEKFEQYGRIPLRGDRE
ncbi:MAG TPA: cbb3-type cytochrome c oxidase subunit 3 [Alphaproteobacteria bacterium]